MTNLYKARAALLDTSINSNNDGDNIIVDAILDIFPELRLIERLPTHRYLSREERTIADNSEMLVVTGTNILTSRLWQDRQWKLKLSSLRKMNKKVVFLGVGWRQYQENMTRRSRMMMDYMTHPVVPVSARDQYTASKLRNAGYAAINTGCPTMWKLPQTLPALGNRDECVFTFTDYNPDKELDVAILASLAKKYSAVHVWPQSAKDQQNLTSLDLPENTFRLSRGICSLDNAIAGRDYVGTRLHAGIRSAQTGASALVVAVDNRAMEISRDTGFPAVDRKKGLAAFEEVYEATSATQSSITLPLKDIAEWTEKFRSELQNAGLGSPSVDHGAPVAEDRG
jgi:polysaccharide pyruvyl transferase WcaK-like protein